MLLSMVFFNTIESNIFHTDTEGTERSVRVRRGARFREDNMMTSPKECEESGSAYEIGNRTLKNRLLSSSSNAIS